MSKIAKIASFAAFVSIIAAPAYAAQPPRHGAIPTYSGNPISPYIPAPDHDWQLDGRLPLTGPYQAVR